MAVFGPTSGFSSFTSAWQSFSASGSFIEVLLQDELRRDRVDRFFLHALQFGFGLHRSKALVDARHRQAKAPLELAREALHAPRERMLAGLPHRQPDDQASRFPLLHEFLD